MGLRVATVSGKDSVLAESAVAELKGSLRGGLLIPGDGGYDEARKIWNGMFDRRPGLIARCAGAGDVVSAVNFARANDLLVPVRGGATAFQVTRRATGASWSACLG